MTVAMNTWGSRVKLRCKFTKKSIFAGKFNFLCILLSKWLTKSHLTPDAQLDEDKEHKRCPFDLNFVNGFILFA